MKRPQTKFCADTMNHSKVIRSKSSKNLSLDQKVFLLYRYFSYKKTYKIRFWYVFASSVAIL